MSDASGPAEVVVEEVRDQVDVGDLVTGDGVAEQIEGDSLGRTIGETVGSAVGERVGTALVDRLFGWLGFGAADENRSWGGRLLRALVVAAVRTLSKPQFRDPIGDSLRGLVERREQAAAEAASQAKDAAEDAATEATSTAEEAASEAKDAAEDAAETAEETAQGGAEQAENTAEQAGEAAQQVDQDTLRTLKQETYRDLLERMDYEELQSIAKNAGVKANQKRDRMIDELVDSFDGEEAAAAQDSDGEASDDADSGDAADENGED